MDLKRRAKEMSEFFDRKIDEYDGVHMRMIENKNRIADILPQGSRRVLDLGVGTGLELCAILEKHGDIFVRGIDVSRKMLEKLGQKNLGGNIETVCGDFFEVDFGEGYDAVISSAALHHFAPKDKAVLYKKVFDCIKPGGIFINSDRIAKDKEEEMLLLKEYENDPDAHPHMDTPLCKETETDLLTEAGFVSVEITDLDDGRYKIVTAKK